MITGARAAGGDTMSAGLAAVDDHLAALSEVAAALGLAAR